MANPVDVPLHEMSTEPSVGAKRALEIDQRPRRKRAKRGHTQRFRTDVGVNLRGRREDDRQTHAVDREAVARRELAGEQ